MSESVCRSPLGSRPSAWPPALLRSKLSELQQQEAQHAVNVEDGPGRGSRKDFQGL